MTIPPIFTWLLLTTLPAGIQLDLEYAQCRVLLNEAISTHDATKLQNVIQVCARLDANEVEQ